MERAERVILTNLCMIQSGTKVLVEEKIGKGADGIIFPGGHVEEHEPIVDAVIREMKEETGLAIERPRLCGVKEWINEDGSRYVVFLFTADRFSGEVVSSEEGRVFWVEKDDVLYTIDSSGVSMNLRPGNISGLTPSEISRRASAL